MDHKHTDPVLDRLLALEPTKTWSLIATVFGDLDGDRLSGKELGTLLAPLGVKPAAMRVALHRLRKDGWITSEKDGREVTYALSRAARRETLEAQKDVYRRDVKFAQGWRLILLPAETELPLDGPHVRIDKALALVPMGTHTQNALNLTLAAPIPPWFETRLVPAHVLAQAAQLTGLALGDFNAGDTSKRLMVLHYWRKMALRTGTWAHIGLMPGGAMAACHAAVARVFDQTARTKVERG